MKNSKMPTKLEMRGRFYLWQAAIEKSVDLLVMGKRAYDARNQQNVLDEFAAYSAAFEDWRKRQPGYTEGAPLLTSLLSDFEQIYQHPFPKMLECRPIHSACIELAIIYLGQIFKSGYAEQGITAGNSPESFVKIHFYDGVVTRVFPDQADQDKFFTRCDELLSVRDKMIAHADDSEFNMKHGSGIDSFSIYCPTWDDEEMEYWITTLLKLRIGIIEYSQDVKN